MIIPSGERGPGFDSLSRLLKKNFGKIIHYKYFVMIVQSLVFTTMQVQVNKFVHFANLELKQYIKIAMEHTVL